MCVPAQPLSELIQYQTPDSHSTQQNSCPRPRMTESGRGGSSGHSGDGCLSQFCLILPPSASRWLTTTHDNSFPKLILDDLQSATSAPANNNRKLCSQISAFLVFRLMADCCHCRLLLIPSKYLRVSSIVVSHECESARSSCSPFSGKINIPNITIFFKQGLQVLK